MEIKFISYYIVLLNIIYLINGQKVNPAEVKCHVCKITVQEIEDAVSKIDPKKTADISGFRMGADGNSIRKTVPLAKSEVYLTELMEDICNKLDDYAKVTYKKNGKFGVIKFMVNGAMNPDISDVNFIQDGDLNKSLQHYCLEILDDYDELILKSFMEEQLAKDIDIKICSEHAKLCNDAPIEEEYNLEEDDDDDFKDEL